MAQIDKRPPKPRAIPKTINGSIAGIIGVSVIFPLDLVKTRLQSQTIGPNGEKQYASIIDCFKQTYAKEGYFGMYRGSAVNIILVTPEKAIKLSFNDLFRYNLTTYDNVLSVPRQILAGGAAGGCAIIITTPMELLKIKMQDQGRLELEAEKAGKQFKRIPVMQIISQILKERGIFGLYTGLLATAARDLTFSGIYFPGYALLSEGGPRTPAGDIPFWWSFVSGCVSACISAVVVTPVDVIKTRLQGSSHLYTSIFDCITKTAKEGPTTFFKGGACRAMVIGPLYGIAQTIYYIGLAEKMLEFIGQ